ncbi:MAG: HesA/MoeB/ThiF family protein [Pseudomonadota bacterium]
MTGDFSEAELDRFARQIVLPEIGGRGQSRLRDSTASLIGVGGLGCPAALYLAAAGIGRLILVDDDVVSRANLHRQVLYTEADVGEPKVDAAAARLQAVSPSLELDVRGVRLTDTNGEALCAEADIVLDGSDSFASRSATARAAAAAGKPLLSGSVQGFEGQVTLFAPFDDERRPCFSCLFDAGTAADALPSCAVNGVLGAMAGQIGTMMAVEAIKRLLGLGEDLNGTLLLVDGLAARIDRIAIGRRVGCTAPAHTARASDDRPEVDSALASATRRR